MKTLFLPVLSRCNSVIDRGHHFLKPLLALMLFSFILLIAGEFRANAQNVCSTGGITNYEPANIVVYTCSNSVPVSFTVNVIDANCPNNNSCYTLDNNPPSGSVFPLGTTTVTSTAIDTTLHWTNVCTFTVTVIQDTNPLTVVYYPTNITLCMDSNGCAYLPDETPMVVAATGTTVSQNISPGTYICNDTNITFTASDPCGDTTNFSASIMLVRCSNSCLQVECPSNIVVSSCTNIAINYDPTVIDCCSNWNVTCTPASGSLFSPGTTNTVTCFVLDNCGNSNSCSFTVTVLQSTNCTNCCPITLSPGILPTAIAGLPYSQTITAASSCAPLLFYSTTDLGGIHGIVFSMTANGVFNTLVNFTGANGAVPQAYLEQGSDGNFYGGTLSGGLNNDGTIFKMTPGGVLTTLVSFNGANGQEAIGRMVQASDGNFYGTTEAGGSADAGTVFKVTPAGVLTTLVSFNYANGEGPNGGLVQGTDGNFYGTTVGGSGNAGTVFKITPGGVLTTLTDFTGANGASPYSPLVLGSDGNFYGTTEAGGSADAGTVFKVTPAGVLTTLVSFPGGGDGYPVGALIQGSDGNFYGTTPGNINPPVGTVFKMTPGGTLTTLVNFNSLDGGSPLAALVQGSDGNFYGTTQVGGSADAGTVFQMTPAGALTSLFSFNGANGEWPVEPLVPLNGSYTFAVTGGSLPPGLTLSPSGALSGTPTTPGVFCFTVTATDPNGCTGSTNYCLTNTCLALYCSNLVAFACTCTNVSLLGAVSATDPCCSNDVSFQFFEGTNSISPTNTCFPVNTTTPVTVVATDGCGNTAANVFDVTVLFGAPCSNACITIVCTNLVAYGCSNCVTVPLTATAIDPCCSNEVSFQYFEGATSISPTNTCFPVNTTNTVEVIATDGCGNTASSDFTVTVLQSSNCTNCLQVICPPDIATNICSTNVQVFYGLPQVIDPCCTNWNTTFSPTNGSYFGFGISNVECVVIDNCGNTNDCYFTVTVLQSTNCTNCLQVICPPDITTNICSTNVQVFYGVPQVIDPCCTNWNITFSPTNGSYFGYGTSNVECIVRDNCGNSNNCIFTVTVLQSANCTNCLQVICPPDIITNICGTNVQVFYSAPDIIDPCCTNWNITFSPTNSSYFGLGTSNVQCIVRDNCGNSNNCLFTVTVNRENCPPIIFLAPTNFILCAGPSGCATMPDEVNPTPNFIRLYNTGVAGTLSFSEPEALPPGTINDPHWTLVSVPTLPPSSPQEFGTNTQLQVNTAPQWVAADNLSSWIAPANDANDDGPEGNYDYQTTFVLEEAANITISGQLAADDSIVDVWLNGVSTGISITNGVASSQLNPFLIADAALAGTNTLDFIVQNNPLIGSNPPTDNQDTPTGLLVQFNSVTLSVSTFSLFTPAAVQATNCNGTPATGWQSIPPGTLLCSSTNITFTFTNPCGDATSYTGRVTVESCCVAPPAGMVLWLTMDEIVGDTCLNSAGNNNGIRYAGNNYANNNNGPKHILGQYVNNCLGFDGSNEKVIVPTYSTIDFGTKNFSMDAWVKWGGGSGIQILLDHRQQANAGAFFGYEWFLDNGVPGIQLATGSGANIHNFLSNKALPVNVWTHLAVTVQRNSATGLNFYTNGVVSSTASLASVTGTVSNSVDLWVGYSALSGAGVPFNGDMDELELFDVTLATYQVYDIFGAETAGKCRPTCSVPAVTTVCIGDNTVVVPVEACNSGSTPLTLSVSFNGLTSAQAGGPPAVNGPPSTSFSGYPATIVLPPNTCTNFDVTIKLPSNLTLSTVAYYQMTIMDAAGQKFDSIGELKRTDSIWCFIWNNPTTNVLIWNQTTNVTFVVNNPSNAVITLNSEVITMDGNLQPETNVVSLNNQAPGVPVTNQIVISPSGSQPVSVNVNYLDAQPWTPYCLMLFLNIGTNGTMVPVASSAFAQVIPPTTGPVVSASTTNGQLVVSWDIVNTGWTLLSTANLNGTNWVPVNLPVLPLPDGSQGVTLLPTNTMQFYRLSGPGSP